MNFQGMQELADKVARSAHAFGFDFAEAIAVHSQEVAVRVAHGLKQD